MGGVGGSTGVLLGGVLTDLLGWRWILFINIPIGVARGVRGAALRRRGQRTASGARHFDVAGALTVTPG